MRNSWILCASVLPSMIFLLLIPEGMCERIIGGQEVTPHSRPYMALLKNNREICAGALIADDWVLTAAHCKMEGSRAQVILGAHSASKDEPEKQIMAIRKSIRYPKYNKKTHEGDLKLLQLKKKAKLNKKVDLLPLPETGQDVKPGTMCHVAGWGLTNNQPTDISKFLKEVNVTVIDRKICNDNKHYNSNPEIKPNMICAGSPKGGKDSCDGDSGSPLLCEGTVRGITSFGKERKCGDPRYPGVYTLLSQKHLKWILTTMKKAV